MNKRRAPAHVIQTDAGVLEATANVWLLSDQLQPLVAEAVKLIAAARVKTDARDTITLASLLSVARIPAVWVPLQEVRALRSLGAQRRRLVQQRTQAGNRLHGVFQRQKLAPPPGSCSSAGMVAGPGASGCGNVSGQDLSLY